MTTHTTATRIRHDSDAMFREWGSEFSTALATVGLVQTADTGQINWGTVTRAAASNDAGYEIWRTNDAQTHVYIKFYYGTGTNASAPRIRMEIGTGSNGTGTITGTALASVQNTSNGNGANNTDTNRNSYWCYVEGAFWFSWKNGTGALAYGAGGVFRSVDPSTGLPDSTGVMTVRVQNTALGIQALRLAATAATYTFRSAQADNFLAYNWGGVPASSLVGGADPQVHLCWTITPAVSPMFGCVAMLPSEYPEGTTFSATPLESTAHTYISMGSLFNVTATTNNNLGFSGIWE